MKDIIQALMMVLFSMAAFAVSFLFFHDVTADGGRGDAHEQTASSVRPDGVNIALTVDVR